MALVPDVAKSLREKVSEKIEPLVESGGGARRRGKNNPPQTSGASIGDGSAAWGAEVVLHVRPPSIEEISRLSRGQILISHLSPLTAAGEGRVSCES